MGAYKLKVMHAEDDTLDLFFIRHNGNAYPRLDNSWCDNYGTVIPYERWFYGTSIPEKADFRRKKPTRTNSVLLSLHIGGTK